MRLNWRFFQMSKLGNRESDCEDSFSFRSRPMKFAIADGVSASIFSDIWARAVTESTVSGKYDFFGNPDEFIMDLIQKAREKWYRKIKWDSLPWYLKNKSVSGSYTTLVGLQFIHEGDAFRYSSFAVGDSVLFHWEGADDYSSYPLSSPEEFNNTPQLVWSGKGFPMPLEFKVKPPRIQKYSGMLRPGGTIFLATDAVGKWLMEYGKFAEVSELLDSSFEMTDLFTREINSKRMRNDDTTLVSIFLE